MSCHHFHKKLNDYAPLSAAAVRRILAFDRAAGFGPGGEQPNRNRFYNYLTQCGSDVQIRTVAVKARKRGEVPLVKEVVRSSADDPFMNVHDLACMTISGYFTDWSPEGMGKKPYWSYERRWDSEAYGMRCRWKINAPVVNPELLKRTKRFRWSAWEPSNGHLLDYLKMYKDHPEIEFLSKSGLGFFCTKVSLVRRLKKDRVFRQFFVRNLEAIRAGRFGQDVILLAYKKGVSLHDAFCEIDARRVFKGCGGLPVEVCVVKALAYIKRRGWRAFEYADYIKNCRKVGLDLADTKVCFPRNFPERRSAVHEMAEAVRRRENAAQTAQMNRQLAEIAEKWSWLAGKRGSYRIVIPRSETEFQAEGKAMANCLGQYAAKVARGETVVVFVRQARRLNEAFVAAAYDPKQGVVTQCYAAHNSKPPKKVRDFVQKGFAGTASTKFKEAA
jgi:hypothetical protein